MSHKHIVVTAPEIYARRFEEALKGRDLDLRVTYLPLISTERLSEMGEMRAMLADIESYDFLAFCSRRAIDSFAEYLSELNITLPSSVALCAIGRDNEALRHLNREPSFVASEPSPKGIVEWFEQHPEHRGKRIAVLAPIVQGLTTPDTVPLFIEGLKGAGMEVHEVGCYITRGVDHREELNSIVESIDGVAFSSGAEIEMFLRSVDLKGRDLDYLIFGPYTALYAQKLGLKVDLINRDFNNFEGFIEEIRNFYNL